MKKNVLVFPSGSEIGLEIHNSLRWANQFCLYGASSFFSNHSKYVYKNYTDEIKNIFDPDFENQLIELVKKYSIDFIFPAHDDVVNKLAEIRKSLPCVVVTSEIETCRICRSKKLTYNFFKKIINTPKSYSKNNPNLKFPLFLKPDIGQGSKGTHIAYNENDINFYLDKDPSLLILEYLPGDEFTVDCFTNKNGELQFVGARKRTRISNGISVDSSVIFDEKINLIAQKINNNMTFRGVWFFQLKKSTVGSYSLLEIAPRVGGTMSLYRNRGINLPLMSLYDFMDIDVSIIENDFPKNVDRALVNRFDNDIEYAHIYIDLDDTIILNNFVNPFVIMFIYQSLNQGKKIHLLTKHKNDIIDTLNRFKIAKNIFESIEQIEAHDLKTNYINLFPSIFIDDSFSERSKVKLHHNIPVFDTNQLESLIDWRF